MSELKDKIKSADDIVKETVECPEWGVNVEVRTMSGFKRAELLQNCIDKDKGDFDQIKWQAGIIVTCSFDPESGEQIFTMEDVTWLMEKSSAPLERIAATATRLNGLAPGALREAENL